MGFYSKGTPLAEEDSLQAENEKLKAKIKQLKSSHQDKNIVFMLIVAVALIFVGIELYAKYQENNPETAAITTTVPIITTPPIIDNMTEQSGNASTT